MELTRNLKHGKNKIHRFITKADSPQLERLLEILEYFDSCQITLHASFEGGDWQKHFITAQSWFDMRATILSFVSMSRYIFSDEDREGNVKESDEKARRYLYPRMFSQVAYIIALCFLLQRKYVFTMFLVLTTRTQGYWSTHAVN